MWLPQLTVDRPVAARARSCEKLAQIRSLSESQRPCGHGGDG